MGTVYFEIVIGETQTVFSGTERIPAELFFHYWCAESHSAYGEVCGQTVTLLSNGTPEEVFEPTRIISLPGLDGYSVSANDDVREFDSEEYISAYPKPSYWREVNPLETSYTSFSDYKSTIGDLADYDINTLYVLPRYLSGGDYSGQGMVSKANVKDFTEEYGEHFEALNIHEVTGDFCSFAIAIPLTVFLSEECNRCTEREMSWGTETEKCDLCMASDAIRETIDGLESYCLINDETLSEMEMADWDEQYEDWGRTDFIGEISAFYPDQYEFDNVTDESADTLFHKLCEASGTYPEMDGDHMYIRLSEVVRECSRADIEALQGIEVIPPEDAEESAQWLAERQEENDRALEGFTYVVCRKFDVSHYGAKPEDANKFNTLEYVSGFISSIAHKTSQESGWSVSFVYRIEYQPTKNETPLMPGYESAETPEVK